MKGIPGQAAAEAAGIIPFIWDKIAAFAAEKQNTRGLIAALRFELSANLDLLDALKADALHGVTAADPAFRALAASLRTEAAASILFSPNLANCRRFRGLLEKHAAAAACFDTEGETGEHDSVFSALSYAVRKIETLKALARLAETGASLLREVNLSLRVERVRKNLLALNRAVCQIAG